VAFMRVSLRNPYGMRGVASPSAITVYGSNAAVRGPAELKPNPAMYMVDSAEPGESSLEPGNPPAQHGPAGRIHLVAPVRIVRRGAPVRMHSPSSGGWPAGSIRAGAKLSGIGMIEPSGEEEMRMRMHGLGLMVPNYRDEMGGVGGALPTPTFDHIVVKSGGAGVTINPPANAVTPQPIISPVMQSGGKNPVFYPNPLPPEHSAPVSVVGVGVPSNGSTPTGAPIVNSPSGQSWGSASGVSEGQYTQGQNRAINAQQAAALDADFQAALVSAQNGTLTQLQLQTLTPQQQQQLLALQSGNTTAMLNASTLTSPDGATTTTADTTATTTDYFAEITAWLESYTLISSFPNWGVLAGVGAIYLVLTRKKGR
jgi:hypothetical protein